MAIKSGRANGAAALAEMSDSSKPPAPSRLLTRTSRRMPERRSKNSSSRACSRSPAGVPDWGSNCGGTHSRSASGPWVEDDSPGDGVVEVEVGRVCTWVRPGTRVSGGSGAFIVPRMLVGTTPPGFAQPASMNRTRHKLRRKRIILDLWDGAAAPPATALPVRHRWWQPFLKENAHNGKVWIGSRQEHLPG